MHKQIVALCCVCTCIPLLKFWSLLLTARPRVRGAVFIPADSLRRFFELAKGHIWWLRVLHVNVSLEETHRYLENTEIIRRFRCFFMEDFSAGITVGVLQNESRARDCFFLT